MQPTCEAFMFHGKAPHTILLNLLLKEERLEITLLEPAVCEVFFQHFQPPYACKVGTSSTDMNDMKFGLCRFAVSGKELLPKRKIPTGTQESDQGKPCGTLVDRES